MCGFRRRSPPPSSLPAGFGVTLRPQSPLPSGPVFRWDRGDGGGQCVLDVLIKKALLVRVFSSFCVSVYPNALEDYLCCWVS